MSIEPGHEAATGRERESAADRAYAFVKERIITGAYPGGSLLAEGAIATDMAISRTPIREALIRLEGEGLLRLYPKRGALVVPVSAAEVADVLDARALIERHAAEAVIRAGRHRQVATAMREILAETTADDYQFAESDRRFHSSLVQAAGNRLLADFYATLRDRQLRMGATALQRIPQRVASIRTEHGRMVRQLASGDLDGVGHTIGEHLAATRASLTGT